MKFIRNPAKFIYKYSVIVVTKPKVSSILEKVVTNIKTDLPVFKVNYLLTLTQYNLELTKLKNMMEKIWLPWEQMYLFIYLFIYLVS